MLQLTGGHRTRTDLKLAQVSTVVGHVVWTTRVTKMYHFVDERVDFSLNQQINIIALNTWQNAIYLQIHPVQFSLKKHDASLIAPTTFCFVRPDGDLAEHTSFQGKKNTTNLFIYLFYLLCFK